jgi:DNA polymerase III gamma/tau subunit
VRDNTKFLAELIRELPDELVNDVRQVRTITERLRLTLNNIQRDAEQLLSSIKTAQHRTTELEQKVQDLVSLATKAAAIEPLAAELEAPSEHPGRSGENE